MFPREQPHQSDRARNPIDLGPDLETQEQAQLIVSERERCGFIRQDLTAALRSYSPICNLCLLVALDNAAPGRANELNALVALFALFAERVSPVGGTTNGR